MQTIESLHKDYRFKKTQVAEIKDDNERARQARISSHLRTLAYDDNLSQASHHFSQSSISVSDTRSFPTFRP